MPLNQLRQVNFLAVCRIKVLNPTLSNALIVVFGCTSAIQMPRVPKCKKCRGEVSNATIPDIDPVDINGEQIKKVRSFCYLDDLIGQRGGCFDATTFRIRSAWKKFRELLLFLTCRGLSLKTRGYD